MNNQSTTLFPTATGNELFLKSFAYLTEIGSLTAPEYCIQNEARAHIEPTQPQTR